MISITDISYSNGIISVSNGISTITDIYNTIDNSEILGQTLPKQWILNAKLFIDNTATVYITEADVTELKIARDNSVTTETCDVTTQNSINVDGYLYMNNVKISGWDLTTNDYIISGERPFFRYAHGDITNTTIYKLGGASNLRRQQFENCAVKPTGLDSSSLFKNNIINDSFIQFWGNNGLQITDNQVISSTLNFWWTNNSILRNNTFSDQILPKISCPVRFENFNHHNLIENNTFNAPSSIDNYYWVYCLWFYVSVNDNIVRNNKFTGKVSNSAIYLSSNSNRNLIENNDINIKTTPTEMISGIEIRQWSFGMQDNIIKNNYIQLDSNFGNRYGILVWNYDNKILQNNIITNNVITNAGIGIGVGLSSSFDVLNTSITNNVIYNCGNGIKLTTGSKETVIENNIISNNVEYGINNITSNNTLISYNDIWNNILGNYNNISPNIGNISTDPLFASSITDDFHLKSKTGRWNGVVWVNDTENSPCLNTGDPTSDNSLSPWGGIIEMGVYGNTPESSNNFICPVLVCDFIII